MSAIPGRRRFIAGCAALAALPRGFGAAPARAAARPSHPNVLSFEIRRAGSVIGTHSLHFTTEGDALTVSIKVEMVVYLGPIPVFRYQHDASEGWIGDEFQGLTSTTNNDGTPLRLSIERSADGFAVDGTVSGKYTAPPGTLPATHWNKHMLDGPFINSESGKLLRPTVTPGEWEMIPTKDGSQIKARPYVLTGDIQLTTWYDEGDTWASIEFKPSDGSVIRYFRA